MWLIDSVLKIAGIAVAVMLTALGGVMTYVVVVTILDERKGKK